MKIAFFVNEIATEDSEFTTTRLAMAAAQRDHEIWYVGVGDVDYDPNEKLGAKGHRGIYKEGDDLKSFLDRAQDDDQQDSSVLDGFDAVWLRNDSIQDLQERPWATAWESCSDRCL